MDLSKLNALSTDTLAKMKAHIETVMASRLDTRPIPGRNATFSSNGETITVRLERRNTKTMSCVELSPKAGRKWRVSHDMLKVVPVERTTPTPIAAPVAPHRPASVASGDAW